MGAYDLWVAVDVVTEVEIARPRAEAAAYASDPDNAPSWYANVKAVEWRSPPALAICSQVARAPAEAS